jgi:hypothetical protein
MRNVFLPPLLNWASILKRYLKNLAIAEQN